MARYFFAKIASINVPVKTPHQTSDWEGKEFTANAVVRGHALEKGDEIYIYVTQGDGDDGLVARGIVSDASETGGKLKFRLAKAELLGPPYIKFVGTPDERLLRRGSTTILANGFLLKRHKNRHLITLELTESELQDIILVLDGFGFRSKTDRDQFGVSEQNAYSGISIADEDFRTIPETEREALINARIGQGQFREDLIAYWDGCAVYGPLQHSVLRASHIKPWRDCNNQERLDPFNGLLLTPNLDHLFGSGLIAFEDQKNIVLSPFLDARTKEILGVGAPLCLYKIEERHAKYLDWHRRHVFKSF